LDRNGRIVGHCVHCWTNERVPDDIDLPFPLGGLFGYFGYELNQFLDGEKFAGRVLVLNAAYDAEALREAYARGRDFGATHLVCTHLDETPRWGRLWEFLLEGELSPLFLSTGPGLTGELETDVLDRVLSRSLSLVGEGVHS
jgi:flagellar biosynthesis GTPase FlhF